MPKRNQRLAVALTATVLLVLSAGAWAEERPCAADGAAGSASAALSPEAARIVNVLISEDRSAEDIAALQAWLDQSGVDKTEPEGFVLRNYARLTVGAHHIRQQRYGKARKLLSSARLDSPAGVESALLTAHSWQLQGNTDRALKWYMRVSARYRASPRVLETLLERADKAARSGDERLATRLYERVVSKALANLRDLAGLTGRSEDLSDVILDHQAARDSAATVSGQLIRELLRGSQPQALPHLQHVIQARQQLACMEEELEAVKEKLFRVSERQTQAGNFRQMAQRERTMIRRRIQSLEQQLENAGQRRRKDLQQQLQKQREKLQAVQQREKNLKKKSRRSESLEEKKQALVNRREELQTYREDNRQAVRRELEQVVLRLKRRYLNIAGEGQTGRASLMRSVALNH